MSFLHGYLLGGLVLTAVPILVHLITREKPKHLRFPAFRFLLQKYQTNRRKLRVHQLLLLILRMLLIAVLCMALARPRLFSERLSFLGGDRPFVVALIVDTSPSMEFERGGLTRLDDAKRRGEELLDELPDTSRVAVFDTAEATASFSDIDNARVRLRSLKIRPANQRPGRLVKPTLDLLKEQAERMSASDELPPRFLYVISDRTRSSWDKSDVDRLEVEDGVHLLYVDVGAEKPTDLAIEQVIVDPPAVPPGGVVQIRAVVRALGERAERKITCRVDDDPRLQEKIVQAEEGARKTVIFEYRAIGLGEKNAKEGELGPGPHQLVLKLEGTDRMPFNNTAYATFYVRTDRKVLTLMDEADPALPWPIALNALRFTSVLRPFAEIGREKLEDYHVVCLHQVTDPSSGWDRLYKYVTGGGRLVIVPGGTMPETAYNKNADAQRLLPATFDGIATSDRGGGNPWDWKLTVPSGLMEPFRVWQREQTDLEFWKVAGEPRVQRWWKTTPHATARTLVNYKDVGPAIVERGVESGKVLLFTTKLDDNTESINGVNQSWQNYWQSSFGLVLADRTCRYLAGDGVIPEWNHLCTYGGSVTLFVRKESGEQFLLHGAGLPSQGVPLSPMERKDNESETAERRIVVTKAEAAGNYTVSVGQEKNREVLAAFSMNVAPGESALIPRIEKETLEEIFGEENVLDPDHKMRLRDALSNRPQSVELLPYLMLGLLLFLALENLIANRNKDRKSSEGTPPEPTGETSSFSLRPIVLVGCWALVGVLIGSGTAAMSSSSGGIPAGAFVWGMFGTFHGLLTVVAFSARDRAILGGLLGSIVGVLYGWLVMGIVGGATGAFPIFLGLIVGSGLLALDGWGLGWWTKRNEVRGNGDGN